MTATSNENDEIDKQKDNVENVEENNLKPELAVTLSSISTSDNRSNTVSESPLSIKSSSKDDEINPWTYNHYARNYAIGLITALYALIMIVYAIMLFLWEWVSDVNDKDAIDAYYSHHTQLSYYHCIVSFIFFGYCYIVLLLKNQRCKAVIHFLKRKLFRKNVENGNNAIIIDNSSLMPHVGCLYLRLGAVLFGIVAVVFYAYSASLKNQYFQSNILQAIFYLIQTHFIYCSTSLFDPKHYLICRFGTMHLFAFNVAHAFQFIFAKGQQNESSLGKVYKLNKTTSVYYSPAVATANNPIAYIIDLNKENNSDESIFNRIVRATADIESSDQITPRETIEMLFGGFSKVFYTGIVEYNLIAAAVMFIVWHNIERIQSQEFIHKFQHKNTIRIHCSKMVLALFSCSCG